MKTVKMSVKQLSELNEFKAVSNKGQEAMFKIEGDSAVNLETQKKVKLDSIRRSWEVVVEETQTEEVAEVVVEETQGSEEVVVEEEVVETVEVGDKVSFLYSGVETQGLVLDINGTLATVLHPELEEIPVKVEALTLVEKKAFNPEAPIVPTTTEEESTLPEVTVKEATVFNWLNEALSPYEEDFSDVDVNDIASALEMSVNSVKGIVGSLTKKGYVFTYNTDSTCMNTGEAIDFDLVCRHEQFRGLVLEGKRGAKIEKVEKTELPKDNKENKEYKVEKFEGEGWSYERTTDQKGNFISATFIVKGEEIKLKSPSKKQVKLYLKENLGLEVALKK